jgi:uncharacterized metal-binding protein YceD (DUF177 family)
MSEGHGFKRTVSVAKIGDSGLAQSVKAQPAEFAQIAAHLDLAGVKALSGAIELARWRGKGVRLTGKLFADVVQTCVVTLEPVDAHVEGTFERRFLPAEKIEVERDEDGEIFVDPTSEDPPEPLGHEIDLGEILIEELALNLDPYPRKPGVEFHAEGHSEPRANPFAVLAKLKPKAP